MMNRTIVISLFIIVTILLSASALSAQTATRADFEEYCKALEGRWITDVKFVTDWPGAGKKGDKITGYWEGRITADGNVLSGISYGGTGMYIGITYFDQGTKQIKGVWVSSGGTVMHDVLFKKDGKWQEVSTGSISDGRKIESKNTLTISDDGKTCTWTGTGGTIGSEKMDARHDVWRRVSK